MVTPQQKSLVLNAFKESIKQLRKGNPRGFKIIDDTLDSLASLIDDEEIIYMQTVIGTISESFVEAQANLEEGDEFLKELADNFEGVAKAYQTNDVTELDKQYKKAMVCLNRRWKKSRSLSKKPSARMR